MSSHHSTSSSAMAVLVSALAVGAQPSSQTLQTLETDVRNFRASHLSSTTLQITVDIVSPGLRIDEARLRMSPVLNGGTVDPQLLEVQSLIVAPGASEATVVLRKRAARPDFVSVAIQACVRRSDRASVCRAFPLIKRWGTGDTAPTPPADPPPPSSVEPPPSPAPSPQPTTPTPPQTCTIQGRLTGRLEGLRSPDTPGPATLVRLRHMVAHADNRPSRTAPVHDRRYTLVNLKAGVRYRVVASGFTSSPSVRSIECRAQTTHRADFHIIGPVPEG